MASEALSMEALAAELAAAPYSALVDVNGIVCGPAMWYKTLPGFGNFEDELFDSKNLTLLGRGKKDAKGKDVSGYYVVCDAGEVMLFTNCIDARAWASNKFYVNEVIAPSLTFMDIDDEELAVVNEEDLVKLILGYSKMQPLSARPVPVSPFALPVAAEVSSASLVLAAGCFSVTCKNASMYGRKMRDLHMAGFWMKSDAVVRFRSSDGKVAVADLLVGVGRYSCVKLAQKAIYTMMEDSDGKLSDLDSLEVDKELFDQKVCTILNYFEILYQGSRWNPGTKCIQLKLLVLIQIWPNSNRACLLS